MARSVDYLPCNYFRRFVLDISRDLIGRSIIVRDSDESTIEALIIETEAYGGTDDPASHAAFRPGGRATQMFGPAGGVYVYAAYGMYPCFNIVTDDEGLPGAVLIRGICLIDSIDEINGPGRVARALGITLDDQGISVCSKRIQISVTRHSRPVEQTVRIGINRGTTIPWRFSAIRD